MDFNELKARQSKIIALQRSIVDKCEYEKREMSTEEEGKYSQLENEFKNNQDELNRIQADVEKRFGASVATNGLTLEQRFSGLVHNKRNSDSYTFDSKGKSYRDSFNRFLIYGEKGLSRDEIIVFEDRMAHREKRNLQSDIDSAGGYLAPVELAKDVIMDLNESVIIRQLARKIQLKNATAFNYPKANTNVGDLEWTSELATGSEDEDLDFGNVAFFPHPLARRIKVSRKLLRTAGISPEQVVREQFRYKLGTVQEYAYCLGTGINQPLGLFVASDLGIDASRDISAGNTPTGVTYDGLVNAVSALPQVYRAGASWLISETLQGKIAKLKDGDGTPIWQQSMQAGMPSMLLGFPVAISSFVPTTFTANQYVGLLGNFQHYLIVDALDFEIQVLTELYAATNQNGYICRYEGDGNVLNSSAFVRIKLGS